MQRQRYKEIDLVRAIGILLVLIGHSNILPQGQNGTGEWYIALFHVAIFYIAAGFVHKSSYSESVKDVKNYILRRLQSLWFPFVLINILLYFIEIYRTRMPINGAVLKKIICILLMFENSTYGATSWFIRAIFYISLLYIINQFMIKYLFKNKYIRFVLHMSFSLGFLLLGYIFRVRIAMVNKELLWLSNGYIFFFLGTIIRQIHDKYIDDLRERISGGYWSVRVILIVISAIVLYKCSWYATISVAGNSIVSPQYYLFVTTVGWILVYSLSDVLCHFVMGMIVDIIALFGKASLFILMLHTPTIWGLVLNPVFSFVFNENITCTSSTMWGVIYIILGMVLPAIIYFKLYIPFERRVFRKE